ncbi:transmembrane protease serine 5 [Protopterus annectens]|uniref:transmembrane protease serine 5 n=1 Tax=Protopterus annectens TaxID=7888 RepID=UPI001CFC3A3F|nr:transmembrane protease serine 5 [Protopterus annectens]
MTRLHVTSSDLTANGEMSLQTGCNQQDSSDEMAKVCCSFRRCTILLCIFGLVVGAAAGIWLLVHSVIKSITHKGSAVGDETEKLASCNFTENDITTMVPKKVSFRISTVDFLLEVKMEPRPMWLLVCHEGWDSSLGTDICRHLGYVRLANHKGVNLTDVGTNYTHGFAQIIYEQKKKLEEIWQFRYSCTSGKVVALKCYECGTRAKVSRIIGGNSSVLGQWPWQVSLYHAGKHVCGGSIITDQWIVTAAHCVLNYRLPPSSTWLVYAGIATLSSAERSSGYTVTKVVYHHSYDDRSHDYDIALIKLLFPLNFTGKSTIRPVCLPRHNHAFPAGTHCWISGWGYTKPDGYNTPDMLREAVVPLINSKKCNSSCMYNGEITPRMLCAGYPEGRIDACQGDSGGPLVCQEENAWRLVGIVSWGTGCAEPNYPGVYTKVTAFLEWIYLITEVASENSPWTSPPFLINK